jgi:uncharacterized protein YlxW (UPF0749 family)
MTLLTSMLERPLDPGYQEAADRRTAEGLPAATSTRTLIVVIMTILTGFLFALSAQSLNPRPTAAASVKEELVSRIESLQAQGHAQEDRVAALTKEVGDLEALALRQAGAADLTETIADLSVQAGMVGMAGPGLSLSIDDAPSADQGAGAGNRPSGGFDSGRVAASDLQIVVNGLWGVGAEAIAINGHRLTSTAAIRFAGQAIIVDFRPLTRPYVITALGDAARMQQLFEPSFAGVYLGELREQFGIVYDLKADDQLTVPGDSVTRLESARPIQPGGSSSVTETTTVPATRTSAVGPTPDTVPSNVDTPDTSDGANR